MSKSTPERVTSAVRAPEIPDEVAEAVRAAADKKATHLVVLDLRKAAGFTDFFVIATGQNARQIRAIAEGVEERLRGLGAKPTHVEGYDRTAWVLLDYFNFVVHVFSPEARAFFGLERLWGSATSIDLGGLIGPPDAGPTA